MAWANVTIEHMGEVYCVYQHTIRPGEFTVGPDCILKPYDLFSDGINEYEVSFVQPNRDGFCLVVAEIFTEVIDDEFDEG